MWGQAGQAAQLEKRPTKQGHLPTGLGCPTPGLKPQMQRECQPHAPLIPAPEGPAVDRGTAMAYCQLREQALSPGHRGGDAPMLATVQHHRSF